MTQTPDPPSSIPSPPPPPPPSSSPPPPPPAPLDPKAAVTLPSLLLMGAGGLYGLFVVALLIGTVTGIGGRYLGGDSLGAFAGIVKLFVWGGMDVALCAVIIYGAMQMHRLGNYNMALVACVAAMLPCAHCCCFLTLPIGIWALIVLMKPEVKAAFTKGSGLL